MEKIDYLHENNQLTVKHWRALMLFISAFASAAYFQDTDDDIVRIVVGTNFGSATAVSFLFWGLIEIENGYIKGRRKRYYRNENTVMFVFL